MRKIYLIIAAALLLMTQGSWAQDATLIDGVYYVLNNEEKTAEVVEPKGFRYEGDIVVPDTVKQDGTAYAVTSLGEGAFMQSKLTSMQLPKQTLRVIGPYAFLESEGLTTIDIPETVTTIGTAAFAAYDLTHMHIPASVTKMGRSTVEHILLDLSTTTHLSWAAWLSFIELDKAVIHVIRLTSFL